MATRSRQQDLAGSEGLLDPIRQKQSLTAIETAGHALELDVAKELVRSESNDRFGLQVLLWSPLLAPGVRTITLPAVPSLLLGRSEVAGLEFDGAREPCRRVHPRIDGDEQPSLDVHAEHECDLVPLWINEDVVVPIEVAAVLDLKAVLVRWPPTLSVFICREGVAHQIESLTCRSSDRNLERSGPRVRVRDNARATRDKRVLDSLDDGLSSDDCVFSQQTPRQVRTFEAYATARSRVADRPSVDGHPT